MEGMTFFEGRLEPSPPKDQRSIHTLSIDDKRMVTDRSEVMNKSMSIGMGKLGSMNLVQKLLIDN